MMEFYASFFMVSTLVLWFLWLRERSKRKYAELNRTSVEIYWRNEEARVREKLLELEAEYNELLTEKQSEGEWEQQPRPYEDEIICTACGANFNIIDNCTERFNYCPNCGARMKGGK